MANLIFGVCTLLMFVGIGNSQIPTCNVSLAQNYAVSDMNVQRYSGLWFVEYANPATEFLASHAAITYEFIYCKNCLKHRGIITFIKNNTECNKDFEENTQFFENSGSFFHIGPAVEDGVENQDNFYVLAVDYDNYELYAVKSFDGSIKSYNIAVRGPDSIIDWNKVNQIMGQVCTPAPAHGCQAFTKLDVDFNAQCPSPYYYQQASV